MGKDIFHEHVKPALLFFSRRAANIKKYGNLVSTLIFVMWKKCFICSISEKCGLRYLRLAESEIRVVKKEVA